MHHPPPLTSWLCCRKNAQDKANKAAELEKEERDHVATAKRLEAEHKDLVRSIVSACFFRGFSKAHSACFGMQISMCNMDPPPHPGVDLTRLTI